MKPIDLSPLIKGVLVFIGIAIATGHYGRLQKWATLEAAKALHVSPEPDLKHLFAR